jgi:ABC-type Fe3+-hydroxamate transport system substrate-binding protein
MPSFTDDLGNKIILTKHPERIVSLVPSITQTIIDLGAADLLVGRTRYCISPEPLVQEIPVVGGTKKINLKKLLSLQPDIVLGNKEENTREMHAAISQHVPFWTCIVESLEDNHRMINQIGEICQKQTEAQAMIAQTAESIKKASGIDAFQGKKVLYLIWRNPWMSVGGDTFIHHILHLLGLENVTAHFFRYPVIDEMLQDLQPDLVFFSSEPYPFKVSDFGFLREFFPNSQFLLVKGEYFSWYGSQMTRAGDYFRELSVMLQ